jgi:hypothetical protein
MLFYASCSNLSFDKRETREDFSLKMTNMISRDELVERLDFGLKAAGMGSYGWVTVRTAGTWVAIIV